MAVSVEGFMYSVYNIPFLEWNVRGHQMILCMSPSALVLLIKMWEDKSCKCYSWLWHFLLYYRRKARLHSSFDNTWGNVLEPDKGICTEASASTTNEWFLKDPIIKKCSQQFHTCKSKLFSAQGENRKWGLEKSRPLWFCHNPEIVLFWGEGTCWLLRG